MDIIYKNTVLGVGENAREFIDINILITFGKDAPDALSDYCYNIDIVEAEDKIKVGNKLYLNSVEYDILFVGTEAQKNLEQLGHITFNFTKNSVYNEEGLPGSVCVYNKDFGAPKLKVGDEITIKK